MSSSQTFLAAERGPISNSLLHRVVLASLYFSVVSSICMGIAAYVSVGQMLEQRAVERLSKAISSRKDAIRDMVADTENQSMIDVILQSGGAKTLLMDSVSIGPGAEVLLVERHEDRTLKFLHQDAQSSFIGALNTSDAAARFAATPEVLKALNGSDGIFKDSHAITVYRFISGTSGAIAVRLPRSSARAGLDTLSAFLAGICAFLLGTASVFSVLLARRITRDIQKLVAKVRKLAPGRWAFSRTIHSGDEAELLDDVVADLTKRLRDTFWGLEGEIAARTEDLRKASAQDRTILATIEHGILLFGGDGRVTGLNPAAVHLIGGHKEKIIGLPIHAALQLHALRQDFSGDQHPALRSIATRQRFVSRPDARLSIVRTDGTLLPVQLVISPIIEHGRCHGGIAVFQDTTEERQVDYMKSEFISLASHQLRTPLSAVLWYIELLAGVQHVHLNKEQKAYIREMDTAAKRMSTLIDALLQVSQLEGGGIRPVHHPITLSRFLTEVAEEIKVTAKDHGVSVALHVPVRSVKIRTDVTLLSIVLQNTLSNAVKYSHNNGHIAITLKQWKRYIDIIIADEGIGIPRADQKYLFQKLFRARNVHKVDATGSGLGLYISKMVMGTLGGSIRLRSRENKGTEVTIRLPVKGGK